MYAGHFFESEYNVIILSKGPFSSEYDAYQLPGWSMLAERH
jgi:hypothetical protein